MRLVLPWCVSLLVALAASGCWVGKTMCRGLHNAMPGACKANDAGDDDGSGTNGVIGGGQPGGSTPVPGTEEIEEVVHGAGFALTRITPEQMIKNLEQVTTIGREFEYDDQYAGQTFNYLEMLFSVPLGGIDFVTATRRDPSTKAQTLLVSRVIAWQFSTFAVWKEWNLAANARVVFSECNMGEDRPYQASDSQYPAHVQSAIRAGEVRWGEQVDALFWRSYARAPTAAEKEAVKTAFLAAFNSEGYPQAAWIIVLYAILSSQEFWHA